MIGRAQWMGEKVSVKKKETLKGLKITSKRFHC